MRPSLLTLALPALALLVLTAVARAQADAAAPFWGGLEPGPHAVGFDSRWVRDADRPYSATLPDGSDWPADGTPVPRPVLVNRWYPAVADGSGAPMVHGDYFAIVPEDDPSLATYARALVGYGHDVILEQLSYDREGLELAVRQGWVDELLATPVPARRGAAPAEGPFPVVLWHSGAGSSFEDNAVFCELLASRGFVVLGSAFPKGDGSSFNVDTKQDSFADLDLLVDLADADPVADASRVGLAGHSAGAHATFQYVTRPGCPVDAAAALDTTQDAMPLDDPRWSGFVEPTLAGAAHLRAPLFVATGPHAAFLLADRLDAVDRWLYTSPVFDHNDYIAQGIQCAERWALQDADPAPAARLRAAYEQLCRDLLVFFCAQLTDDAGARQALDALHADAVLGGEVPSGPNGRPRPAALLGLSPEEEPHRTVPHVAFVPAGTRGPEPYDPESGQPPTPRQLRPLLAAVGADETAAVLERFAEAVPRPPVWHRDCVWSLLRELVREGRVGDVRRLWDVLRRHHLDMPGSQRHVARFYAEYNPKYRGLLRETLELALVLDPGWTEVREELDALIGFVAAPPPTRRQLSGDGEAVADPYAWLSDLSTHEARQWLAAQDDHADAVLAAHRDPAVGMVGLLEGWAAAPRVETPECRGDLCLAFVDGLEPGGPVLCRLGAGPDGADLVVARPADFERFGLEAPQLVDFRLDRGGRRVVVTAFSPGRGRLGAVLDLASGAWLPPRLPEARLSRAPWAPDDAALTYTTPAHDEEPAAVWWQPLDGTPARRLLAAGAGRSTRYSADVVGDVVAAVARSADGPLELWRLHPEALGGEPPHTSTPASRLAFVGEAGDHHHGPHDAWWHEVGDDGVHRLARRPGWSPSFDGQTPLTVADFATSSVHLVGRRLVLEGSLPDGTPALRLHPLDGADQATPLVTLRPPYGLLWTDFPAGRSPLSADPTSPHAYLNVKSLQDPGIYRLDSEALTLTPWRLQVGPGTPPLTTRRVTVTSADGTEVPMTLVHRADLPADTPAPTLIWVYGAYGFTATPWSSAFFHALTGAGGVLAMPQVRGGGVHGEAWAAAGRGPGKRRTVEDTVAAVSWLIDHGVTAPGELAVMGNSAGSVPAALAALACADRVGALLLEVPVADLEHHALVTGQWTSEFGDPALPAERAALTELSPYRRALAATVVPPTLVFAGARDTTAPPDQAARLVAALQAVAAPGTPVLLRWMPDAAHQLGADREQRTRYQADQLAFLSGAIGLGRL